MWFASDRSPLPSQVFRFALLRPYARLLAFITKTRTIVLFTNTTLNRLEFEEQLQAIFASKTMKQRNCWHTSTLTRN